MISSPALQDCKIQLINEDENIIVMDMISPKTLISLKDHVRIRMIHQDPKQLSSQLQLVIKQRPINNKSSN